MLNRFKNKFPRMFSRRSWIAPALVVAMMISFAAYEVAKPVMARAAVAAPPAAALDSESVSALLALDRATEAVASRVTPAIVNIAVTSRNSAEVTAFGHDDDDDDAQRFFGQFFGQRMPMPRQPQVEHVAGSGAIISPDGYIVTNEHVVHGAVDIRVTMSDRRTLRGKVIGTDPLTDLAVVKVSGSNLPSVPWGDSTKLHPGQSVLAFGNPFGWFRFSVTRGIVSALNRPNPYSNDARKPGEFIQTDAAINQGNSGGPLVDARGQVVGINTFLISPSGAFSGMGFAIPSQIAKPTVEALIRDGKIEHGYMGVGITDVTPENAEFFHRSDASGAIVTQVEPDSPGAKAGLKTGDVITAVDGQSVSSAGQLQVVVGQKRPGSKIDLQLSRDDKSMNLPVTLEAMDSRDKEAGSSTSSREHGKGRWGIGLSDPTSEMRDQLRIPRDMQGAVVTQVEPGSSADNAGLSRGDVILEVDRHPTRTSEEVRHELSSVAKGHDALLLVFSRGGNSFRVLHSPDGA